MRLSRVSYHIARADFLERSRSYGFLIILCLSFYLGYAINTGQIVLRFNICKEIFDTALVGVMMAIAIGFFLGFFGFYLVKGSINRDERTGIGQILAATPLQRLEYIFGKWLSHFAVLGLLWAILVMVTALIQIFRIPGINLAALLMPLFLVTLPFIMLVAALAVLFETIPFLKGGLGNLVYFFMFIVLLMLLINPSMQRSTVLADPSGIRMLLQEIKSAGLDCGGKTSLAEIGGSIQDITWNGMAWSTDILLSRFGILVAALLLIGVSSVFFKRFNIAGGERKPKKQEIPSADSVNLPQAEKPIHLTPLIARQADHNNLLRITMAEIRLLLKGNHWIWYLGVAGLWIATLLTPEKFLGVWLAFMALWPLLAWSKMGLRESLYSTQQIVFSCPRPLVRLLFCAWLAGVCVTAILWSGAAIHFALHLQEMNLLAWGLAVLLVPSLALALGVWTGASKVFEVVYLIIWYIGIVSRLPALDFLGLTPQAIVFQHPLWISIFLAVCILLAFIGRRQKLLV